MMIRSEANALLDRLRKGEIDLDTMTIWRALIATGDLGIRRVSESVLPESGRDQGWQPGARVRRAEERDAIRAMRGDA